MKKRLLALFLAFVMAMSLLPVSVFAAGEGGSVANGYYDKSGTWQVGGDGTIMDEDTGIQMSKTAKPDPSDPNKYTIKLEVKTSTKTTVTDPSAAAVVLVMDLSNSMKACAECGGEDYHKEGCKYYGYYGYYGSVQNTQTRLTAAKNAAKAFLEEYAGHSATAERKLAIVAFGTTSKTVFSWNNVAGGDGKNSYDAAKNAINDLTIGFWNGSQKTLLGPVPYSDGGGTNLEAGIQLGANLIGRSSIASVSAKNVIVLTDGVPTRRMSIDAERNSTDALCSGKSGLDGDGKDGSQENNNNAKNAANDVKQKNATVYTVCFGVANKQCYNGGPTVGDFLSGSIASSGCDYNADNTDELNNAFKAIGGSITQGIEGKGLKVTDPMGEYINLNAVPYGATATNNGFTWILSDPETSTVDNTTYYTYRLAYTITVNADAEGFNEDIYHPANGPTYITIPGGGGGKDRQVYFPVPGVKGTSTSCTVTYAPGDHGTLAGANTDGTVVHGDLKKGDNTPAAPKVIPAEDYYFTGWSPDWSETVTETVTYTAQYAQQGEITVQANSNTVTYDGHEQTVSGYIATGLPEGFTLEDLTATASGTDAGFYPVQVTGTAVITDQDGNDVTDQFAVTTKAGTLDITKRNVTLTSASGSKTYDGTPLTNDTVTVGDDGFAAGEGATYIVTGSQTLPGNSQNAFTYTLTEGTKASNYTITPQFGTLTITDRPVGDKYPITVTAKSGKFVYDGNEKTVSGFETLTFTVDGKQYTVEGLTAEAKATNLGTYSVAITGNAVVKDAENHDVTAQFDITKVNGTMTILGTLTYNGNGQGENPAVNGVPTDDGQYAKGEKKTLSEKKPTHSAVNGQKVVFIGWSKTKSDKIYSAGESHGTIVDKVTFEDRNITVYAVWGYDTNNNDDGHHSNYTLYYHSNFGEDVSFYQSSSTRNVTVKEYDDVGRLPERDGYVFVSWNTEPDGSGTRYMPGDPFRIEESSDHLYAQWQKDKTGPDDSGVSNWLETDEHRAYLTGYPDSTFRADRNMTRAEVAQMFYALLLDKNVTITKSFSDVPDDAWYATAVKTLASLGMMDGYPDGTFRPDEPITRAEFATVGLAFAYDPLDADCSYYDVSASAWYHTYVAQATTYGWIGGYPDNTFRPGNNITRVEVCVIVNNMLGRDADERYIDRHEDELVHFVDLSDSYWGYYTIMEATNTHEYTGSFTNEKWTDVK